MYPSVYLETTIPSYLTAWPSSDVIVAAKQEMTRQWWDRRRHAFDLLISDVVLREAACGDPSAAARRLAVLDQLPILEAKPEADSLVAALVDALSLPQHAVADAAHIAICVVNGIDYLLTWNFTHIANTTFGPKIDLVCRSAGYIPPVICSPQELLQDDAET